MIQIVDFIIDILAVLFILRLALEPRQFFFNPMLQPVHKITEILMKPLRLVFKPTKKGFDYTPLIAIAILVIVRAGIVFFLAYPHYSSFRSSLMDSLIRFITFVFQAYLVMLVMSAAVPRTTLNPLGRFIYQVLDPLIRPLEKIFPGIRAWILIPAVAILVIAHIAVIYGLAQVLNLPYTFPGTIYYTLVKLVAIIRFFYIMVIVGALMSWLSPDPSNPIVQMIRMIVAPLLRPVQRFLPPLGGIDFSPIIVIFALVYIQRFLLEIINQIFLAGRW